jgi:hypothetical protein
MKATTGMALMLTAVAGLLVGCATAPTSRADRDALLAEATSAIATYRRRRWACRQGDRPSAS